LNNQQEYKQEQQQGTWLVWIELVLGQ
jgi:hypothetical protein